MALRKIDLDQKSVPLTREGMLRQTQECGLTQIKPEGGVCLLARMSYMQVTFRR
jgi:hypothetical protein